MEIINVDFLSENDYATFQPFCNTDMFCPITAEAGGGSGGGGGCNRNVGFYTSPGHFICICNG